MFKNNSTILVDLDGVLADFDKALEKIWNVNPKVAENNWYPLHEPENPTIKLPPQLQNKWGEDAVKTFRSILNSGDFFINLPEIPYAVEGVKSLAKSGHEIFICTKPSRNVPSCASEKIMWVRYC